MVMPKIVAIVTLAVLGWLKTAIALLRVKGREAAILAVVVPLPIVKAVVRQLSLVIVLALVILVRIELSVVVVGGGSSRRIENFQKQ